MLCSEISNHWNSFHANLANIPMVLASIPSLVMIIFIKWVKLVNTQITIKIHSNCVYLWPMQKAEE